MPSDELQNLINALKPQYNKELQFEMARSMAFFAFKHIFGDDANMQKEFITSWRKRMVDAFESDFKNGEYKTLDYDEEMGNLQDSLSDVIGEFYRVMNV